MIYTALDTFYLTDEQLRSSPSRKDGVDEETEAMLRLFGCELIQESGILLGLPQAVMATGQVLFHRFYCKKSFTRFNVKRLAASCVWLAAKLEENPRKISEVVSVFHRMECRRENIPLEFLDIYSKAYGQMRVDLIRTERHLLKEMGFICHVEHPHKFVLNYLLQLDAPQELIQEGWSLANDSLRTTLCVRFKSEVVACGVVYAAARRLQFPLPENPPWWLAFEAQKSEIDEVCRVMALLYQQPKARYIEVCKGANPLVWATKTAEAPPEVIPPPPVMPAKESAADVEPVPASANGAPPPHAESEKASGDDGGRETMDVRREIEIERDRRERDRRDQRDRVSAKDRDRRDYRKDKERRDHGRHSRRHHPY